MTAPIVVLDLDRTLASFPATTRLYHRLLLEPIRPAPALYGLLMLVLMHGFWFVPAAVRLQRRIVMSLLSRVPAERLGPEIDRLVEEVVADWRSGLGARLEDLLDEAGAVYLVSHCPRPLAEGVAAALELDGQWSVPIADYLRGAPGGVYDKRGVLNELRGQWPEGRLYFFADDLVDLPGLRAADVGTLINGSWFSRLVCRSFFRRIRVWS